MAGPYPDAASATAGLDGGRPDCAVVDINLGHGPSFDFARAVLVRGVPLVLVTGYDLAVFPADLRGVPYLMKPVEAHHVVAALHDLLHPPPP